MVNIMEDALKKVSNTQCVAQLDLQKYLHMYFCTKLMNTKASEV